MGYHYHIMIIMINLRDLYFSINLQFPNHQQSLIQISCTTEFICASCMLYAKLQKLVMFKLVVRPTCTLRSHRTSCTVIILCRGLGFCHFKAMEIFSERLFCSRGEVVLWISLFSLLMIWEEQPVPACYFVLLYLLVSNINVCHLLTAL